ncbi:MAG: hypothetical protein KC635_26785 [Myxococcales bacterium]|nr:hypothetical protein [Myxococcales bacterium]MCB9732485.1 hypothetical protein [Deltaproteobacteria bacterium]
MDATTATLSTLRRFATAVRPDLPAVDVALPAARALLAAVGADYRVVGGVAVVHHGYERLTVDVDVLLGPEDAARLDVGLAAHGFRREGARRLRHEATGVLVDLLVTGDVLPGRSGRPVPAVADVPAVAEGSDVAALPALMGLKLDAGRRQDVADVVALLKTLDDGAYLALEADAPRAHRAALAALRDEALEELRWARERPT